MRIRPRIHRKWIKFEACAVFVDGTRQQGNLPTSLPPYGTRETAHQMGGRSTQAPKQ
jgi:hypothetical protein